MAFGIYDIRMPYTVHKELVVSDGTSPVNLHSQDTPPVVLLDLLVTNDDTIPHILNLLLVDMTGLRQLGSVNVPAGQGYGGTPPIYVGASILPPLLQGWGLLYGQGLSVSLAVAMSTGKVLHVVAFGGYV